MNFYQTLKGDKTCNERQGQTRITAKQRGYESEPVTL